MDLIHGCCSYTAAHYSRYSRCCCHFFALKLAHLRCALFRRFIVPRLCLPRTLCAPFLTSSSTNTLLQPVPRCTFYHVLRAFVRHRSFALRFTVHTLFWLPPRLFYRSFCVPLAFAVAACTARTCLRGLCSYIVPVVVIRSYRYTRHDTALRAISGARLRNTLPLTVPAILRSLLTHFAAGDGSRIYYRCYLRFSLLLSTG